MPEPYCDEHADLAQDILGRALEELIAAGLGHVEAMHALVHFAIDTAPAFACRDCLPGEYAAMVEAILDRIAGIADIPDDQIAQACPGHLH